MPAKTFAAFAFPYYTIICARFAHTKRKQADRFVSRRLGRERKLDRTPFEIISNPIKY